MNKGNIQLIPVAKAGEEFGVSRQTIINWHDAGILQGTSINGGRFVTRESLDNLKQIYPEAMATVAEIDAYKLSIEEEKQQLKSMLEVLKKERIYRGYAPRYMNNFIENAVKLLKTVDEECVDELLDDQFIRCWLFGHDISETCEKNGVTYFRYIASAKRYIKSLKRMEEYCTLVERNRTLEQEIKEMNVRLNQLEKDLADYRSRSTQIDNEQMWREQYPILTMKIEELNLSCKTKNILKFNDLDTLEKVVKCTKSEILKLRNCGKKSLFEIMDFLESYGLELDMKLDKYPPK